MLYIDICTYI